MDIIFKTQFGSHLYGTNTPSSDKDYKGVYIQDFPTLLLRKNTHSLHQNTKSGYGERNTSDDIDIEYIELSSFVHDALKGQTYAIDMLFAPQDLWEAPYNDSVIWSDIVNNREKFLSKNVAPYIGYCRKQAAKYGLKGSRLGEVIRLRDWAKAQPEKLRITEALAITPFPRSEYIFLDSRTMYPNGKEVTQEFLNVLGKLYSTEETILDLLVRIEEFMNKYGSRSIQAQENDGVDWKAISHAYRACFQMIELALYGKIHFPLHQKDFLIEIKQGKKPYSFVQEDLPLLMEKATHLITNSTVLPEQPDTRFWDKWLLTTYQEHYGIQKLS